MEHITSQIREFNKAGNPTATYIQSYSNAGLSQRSNEGQYRVDTIKNQNAAPVFQRLLQAFLPSGYPQSVTEDYLWYQIFDSLQAFASSIAGLISSRAVLEGIGVGDTDASPTNAIIVSIVQESMGRIATILFADRFSSAIEPECKMYRLAADIFNDTAMVVDCVSPLFPKQSRMFLFGTASMLRALCGVAAGGSKASLSQHFAKWSNVAELNAKDSSQETVISLLGMLMGSFVISYIKPGFPSWILLLLLIMVHLGTNYAAVRAVHMRTLNRQRLNIVCTAMIEHGKIPDPAAVSFVERIFEVDGIIRHHNTGHRLGTCRIGCSIHDVLQAVSPSQRGQSAATTSLDLASLTRIFSDEEYLLCCKTAEGKRTAVFIALKEDAQTTDQIKAWVHAFLLARECQRSRSDALDGKSTVGMEVLVRDTLSQASRLLDQHLNAMQAAGWNLEVAALETRPGYRIQVLK